MTEMVERVARAIYETWAKNRNVTEPWDEVLRLGHSVVQEARSEASAAIEAMREPTTGMLEAMWAEEEAGGGSARELWLVAIAAALTQSPQERA